jgi:hypothetical protein
VRVPVALRGMSYRGRPLGRRAGSLAVHLLTRVLLDQQWADVTTEADYLDDLRRAVRDAAARLAAYERRGGPMAASLAPNTVPPIRRGVKSLPWLFVVYSADRGSIISAYQVSGLEEVRISGDIRWLK